MKNILISGGAGFIGSNLALKLLDSGYEVTVLDNLSPQIHGDDPEYSYTYSLIKDRVRFIRGSVENKEDWKKSLEKIDIVVHLAAETGTGQSMYEIEKYVSCNIGGTANLLEILTNEKHDVKKIVLASSRAVYGEGKCLCPTHGVVYPVSRTEKYLSIGDFNVKCPICNEDTTILPTDENSLLHPTSVYGFTKQAQEQLCFLVGQSLNLPVVAFRFQNVYGPGQSLKNPYTGILSIFSTRIKNGNALNIFEDGHETRDFVYIEDVTDAIVLGIQKETADFNVFNVGSGESVEVLTVAETLREKYKSGIHVQVSGNYRLGDIRYNLADLTKIQQKLGYEPKIDFRRGISDFIDWVESQPVERDYYEESVEEMKRKRLFK